MTKKQIEILDKLKAGATLSRRSPRAGYELSSGGIVTEKTYTAIENQLTSVRTPVPHAEGRATIHWKYTTPEQRLADRAAADEKRRKDQLADEETRKLKRAEQVRVIREFLRYTDHTDETLLALGDRIVSYSDTQGWAR